MCVCLCAVLQVFQSVPELLHPQARLHLKDIFSADAAYRPPDEGTSRVGSRALLGPAHAQLPPWALAERQPRGTVKSRACSCQHTRCYQPQTDPGGSLQGVRNVDRIEKEQGSPIGKQILYVVEKSEPSAGVSNTKLGRFNHRCSVKSANRVTQKKCHPASSCTRGTEYTVYKAVD